MAYEYRVVSRPDLPPIDQRRPSMRTSPCMSSEEMENWLNMMDEAGWEFVGYGQTLWATSKAQEWWIFRRRKPKRG